MQRLGKNAWEHYRNFEDRDLVVDPSIPILYFGDLEAYRESSRKIVTVGLNPSNNEFPFDDESSPDEPFSRFDNASVGDGYFRSLNEYFRRNPYWDWFKHYQRVLEGLNASYTDEGSHVALHTDLCTPLATQDKWGDLPKDIQQELISEGRPLWKRLVCELEPDLVIASVAKKHLEELPERGTVETEVDTISRNKDGSEKSKPYRIVAWPYQLSGKKEAHLVYGQAMFVPFGKIANEQKERVGRKLANLI